MIRWLLALVVGLAGCTEDAPSVRIGAKDFTEQRILAEILGEAVETAGARKEIVHCGDTYECQQSLRRGDIDMMVEYTGTGFLYSGATLGARADFETVRDLYRPLGLLWTTRLGFDNSYVAVMPRVQARGLGAESIEDLAKHPKKLRFALPRSYLGRPSDGYAPLLARHGIQTRAEPLVIDDTAKRIGSLKAGLADVAIVYRTDAERASLDLIELQDSLGFFPPYEATIVLREEAKSLTPAVRKELERLSDTLTEETMSNLNRRVRDEGLSERAVALQFLEEHDPERPPPPGKGPSLIVSVASSDHLEFESKVAARTVRQVYSTRTVALRPTKDPVRDLVRGKSRLAVLGAERFFDARTSALERVSGVEAIAVVGHRLVHVIGRSGLEGAHLDQDIGIEATGSGSNRVAAALLQRSGKVPKRIASRQELIQELQAGKLDVIVLFSRSGDREISGLLQAPGFELYPLADPAIRGRLPHLRPARIPPGRYPRQEQVIETLGAQVVLAGPVRNRGLRAGPVAALPGDAAEPVDLDEAERLSRASPTQERPDAVLPSPWTRAEAPEPGPDEELVGPILDTSLNLGVFLFLGWLVIVTFRRGPSVGD